MNNELIAYKSMIIIKMIYLQLKINFSEIIHFSNKTSSGLFISFGTEDINIYINSSCFSNKSYKDNNNLPVEKKICSSRMMFHFLLCFWMYVKSMYERIENMIF